MKKDLLNILIFGNTNNYPYRLAIALNSLGHRVSLILNTKYNLHRPYSLIKEKGGDLPQGVILYDLSELNEDDYIFETHNISKLIRILNYEYYDFCILNDIGPSLSKYIKIPHMSFLTGSDLTYYANFDTLERISSKWDCAFKRSTEGLRFLSKYTSLILRQREGISKSKIIYHAEKGLLPEHDKLLNELGIDEDMRIFNAMSDLENLNYKAPSKNKKLNLICGSRINFKNSAENFSSLDIKGVDILLKGFSKFIHKGYKAQLKLFLKGRNINDAKKLIENLNIKDSVKWKKEISLNDFYNEIRKSDLVCDQFSNSYPGMILFDSFAIGRPVMGNLKNKIFKAKYGKVLPGFNTTTIDSVTKTLIKIENDRSILERKGKESREFALEHFCPKKFARYIIDSFTKK